MYKFIEVPTKPGDLSSVRSRLEVMVGIEEVYHDPGSKYIIAKVRSESNIIETIKKDPGVNSSKVKYLEGDA